MNIKISSTGGLLLGDATNGYKEIASKEYVDTKTFSIAWGDITGKPSTFAPASHTHSDYVSKSATSVQTIASPVRLSGGKGFSVGYGENNGGYVYLEGTSNSGGGAYIDIIKGGELEGIEITNNSLIYTNDGFDTTSTLVFPPASSASKIIATTDQIPAAQVNANWNETSSSSKAYIQNKPALGTAAAKDVPSSGNASTTQVVMGNDSRLTDARTPTSHTHSAGDIGSGTLDIGRIPTGTSSSTVALGNHTHSDYVSKSATAAQSLHSSISTTLSSGEIKIKSSATSAGEAGLYVDSSDGYVWVGVGSSQSWLQKDRIGYTADGNTQTELMFPARTSSDEVKTIATTDQLLQIGTTATTAAAGNHTHSGYAASSHNHAAGNITSGTLAVARGGTGADGSSITKNYVLAAPSGSNGAVSFRALVAADIPSHTHDNYLDKSATTLQTLSGSLSIPYGKELIVGEPQDGYGINLSSYSNNVQLLISKDFDEYCWLTSNGIGFTTDGESTETTLSYPPPAKSGVIATEYDIRKRTRVLYESVIGDSSTPASAVTISEDYNIYHFWIGTNGTFPTFTFSFPNFESISARFPFTLIAHVASGATTLTGPSGWAWTSGAGLPTSGFAGKVLWISGLKKTNDSTAMPLVSCWRCA